MRNKLQIAVAVVALMAASPLNAAEQKCAGNDGGAAILAQDYAGRIDGLLRDVQARLHEISERVEAGDLSPAQAEKLKLAATRDMIARLETASAVYDAKFGISPQGPQPAASSACRAPEAQVAAGSTTGAKATVTVEELKQEASQ